jgi:C4-dicarboxylate-specific signal transduction histidine kinase
MSKRIAVIAPKGRDAEVIITILRSAALDATRTSLDELLPALERNDYGAAILTQEALMGLSLTLAEESLRRQPPWSDFPFVLLTTPDGDGARIHLAGVLGNVTQVERPVLPTTLINCAQAALRARLRQHEMRDLLEQQVRAEQQISELAQGLEKRVQARTLELEKANIQLAAEIREKEEAEAKLQDVQSKLIRVSRVSAANTMASTIAHELNQPLAATVNYLRGAERLLQKSGGDQSIMQAVNAAASNAHRAGAIIRHLRAMVSNAPVTRMNEPLTGMIDDARHMGLLGLPTDATTFDVAIANDADLVVVDRIQIEQVFVNLFRNSLEAMSGTDRFMKITSERDGDLVKVRLQDNGPGFTAIPSELSPTAFSSTKTDGLGIGLSICRTIIEANGGALEVANADQGGALITFTLPAASLHHKDQNRIVGSS